MCRGFIKTGVAVAQAPRWQGAGRVAGPRVSSVPGLFAAGGVGSGSV